MPRHQQTATLVDIRMADKAGWRTDDRVRGSVRDLEGSLKAPRVTSTSSSSLLVGINRRKSRRETCCRLIYPYSLWNSLRGRGSTLPEHEIADVPLQSEALSGSMLSVARGSSGIQGRRVIQ
eukprot:9479933-Pyramimonas_sp.AAC.1